MAHSWMVLREWEVLENLLEDGRVYNLTGSKLSLGSVVAASRYRVPVDIDEACLSTVAASAAALMANLDVGQIIYGVNTGFGGSADSRTEKIEELQRTLIRELHYGIGASAPIERTQRAMNANSVALRRRLPMLEPLERLLPNVWVRASILVRINSLIAGHSGIRQVVVQSLSQLLNHDILPLIPLRGSISASGDLSPLSYIAGAIQGKPTVRVRLGSADGSYSDTTAAEALDKAGVTSVKLVAKEGLAIVNGTAVSAGVASLALWEAHQLAIMAQLLTCMSVEALCGTDESFDPLFAHVRPHPGQIDCSNNMFRFLERSLLVHHNDGNNDTLRQDRYSIRTASQWLGPALEDLLLAHQQIQIELNSVTDNPIIDMANGRMLHGGNFQAKAVTSAMEKVRSAIQSIGRMLFAQCTELINPATNRGLPPNLTAEDPSTSFVMKAVDLMTAALQSELGFLANPVGSHVQTAEMGNQSLNSLALISARYTHTALDVLTQLVAAHLFALCQALDLRAMNLLFLKKLKPQILDITETTMSYGDGHPATDDLWAAFLARLEQTTRADAGNRFNAIMESLQPVLIRHFDVKQGSTTFLPSLDKWTETCAETCLRTFEATREEYGACPNATPYLGVASQRLYIFLRDTLNVPFLRSAHIRTPYPGLAQSEAEMGGERLSSSNAHSTTVGSYISAIDAALRSGELYGVAMECLRNAQSEAAPPDGLSA
ncbi:MAG: hypothetical protein Q9207_006805 [Kuettlingeria erythrocarpa]